MIASMSPKSRRPSSRIRFFVSPARTAMGSSSGRRAVMDLMKARSLDQSGICSWTYLSRISATTTRGVPTSAASSSPATARPASVPRKYSTQAKESRTRSKRASGLMGLVRVGEGLHVAMGAKALEGGAAGALEEHFQELLERLRLHPTLERLELLVHLAAHLDGGFHRFYWIFHGSYN